ncbi:unnamed protein product [Adineta steineri]|uniref:Uncharacterized protein n=1 Tax=Adineta steineri TaxID=433720 RepID=A0A813PJ94_9BILA|nr:unnamed protein product [Adineta steineri]CAF0822529.1 unnamed protein product [Adineta steineri]CAF0863001.1 unnamed protein product [Adineta steineri]
MSLGFSYANNILEKKHLNTFTSKSLRPLFNTENRQRREQMNHQTRITMIQNEDQILEEQITPLADTTETVLSNNASTSSTRKGSKRRRDHPLFLIGAGVLFLLVLWGIFWGGVALLNIIPDTNGNTAIRMFIAFFCVMFAGCAIMFCMFGCGYLVRTIWKMM